MLKCACITIVRCASIVLEVREESTMGCFRINGITLCQNAPRALGLHFHGGPLLIVISLLCLSNHSSAAEAENNVSLRSGTAGW